MIEIKFLTKETQDAIYTVAHKYEKFEILKDYTLENSFYKNVYVNEGCDFGLERAISDFLLQENDFDVDGEYSDIIRKYQGENYTYKFYNVP